MGEDNFVTEDAAVKEGRGLHEVDRQVLDSAKTGEGLFAIGSAEQLRALASMAKSTFDSFQNLIEGMTEEQAKLVRWLRVDEGHSWRGVAASCYEHELFRNVADWLPPSNQLMGMALCNKAAELFGEDYMLGPWN